MKTKLFFLLFAIVASMGVATAGSFVGFEATSQNKMGNQIYTQGLIQNTHNITLIETDATKHKYNINLTNGGEGTFQMGGVTFSYTNDEAGKTAYKTYDTYIQPNGVDREIRIPTTNGERVKVVLEEDCANMLVDGTSRDFIEGNNVLTAKGSSIILRNPTNKPKISAILSLEPGPEPIGEAITVRLDPQSCSKWSTVYLYYWGYEDHDELSGLQWPGIVVNKDNDGWYSYTFSAIVKKANIIWTNGKGYQTIDITDVSESTCYALNSQYGTEIAVSIVNCPTDETPDPGPPGNEIWYTSSDGKIVIPNRESSLPSIVSNTYVDGKGVIKFAEPVTSIRERAFSSCTGLTSMSLPNSVTSIRERAFSSCTGLTSVSIPNSVTSIGEQAFSSCTGLTSVSIPNSVTSIGEQAFSSCTGLTSVSIPNSVTSIGNYAFSGCYSLPVENHLRYADTYLVEAVNKTQSIYTIKEGTRWIGNRAFYNCTSLTSVTFPNSVTNIGDEAFSKCTLLRSVTIPNSVTSIGQSAFSGCYSLPVENHLRYADTYLVEAVNKTQSTYTIKEGTRWIGNSAFSRCTDMTSIEIPNSVTSIGHFAFSDSEISLSSIHCYAILPPAMSGTSVFTASTLKNADLCVPVQSIVAYFNADQWGRFVQISPIEPNAVNTSSFVGFQATENNTLGNQIYYQNLIQNKNNVVLKETDTTNHKYNINLVNGGEGSFTMGGVTFSYTHSLAGKTAYQTDNTYIQPFGEDREIRIPARNGELIDVILDEACSGSGMLVDGFSKSFRVGHNILTAKGSSITLKYSLDDKVSRRPAINAIKSLSYTIDNIPIRYGINVRLDPHSVSTWSEVRLCAWTSDGNLLSSWPGTVINKDETGWYSYTFDINVQEVNIIWTNGSDQTVDLTNITESTCFALNSTSGTQITARVVDCPTEVMSYTIAFKDWDGTVLKTDRLKYGEMPIAPAAPSKPADEEYTYTFAGWTPEIVVVTKDATYTATYEATHKSQGIEDVNADEIAPRKVMIDNVIYILRCDHTYTLTGQEVR